jgi:hypothetical protein
MTNVAWYAGIFFFRDLIKFSLNILPVIVYDNQIGAYH